MENRRQFSMVEWRGRLFAMGGVYYDEDHMLSFSYTIEQLDGIQWKLLNVTVPKGKSRKDLRLLSY